MLDKTADVAIIGGGIVGLAHALAAARRGMKVVVFERTPVAAGASVRNFGLLWPIGQPDGERHELAMRSRAIWEEVAREAQCYLQPSGSLHLAYEPDEWNLLQECAQTVSAMSHGRLLLSPREVSLRSTAVQLDRLKGGLWSGTEATVDPRQATRLIPKWLEAHHGVSFCYGAFVHRIDLPEIETTLGQWKAERAVVCSGQDLESLYPEVYAEAPLTRCKLQMLRTESQPDDWELGPALCAGLTLTHYDVFKRCSSLAPVRERFERTRPFFMEHGIHVLVSQTGDGEITLGDSHHYGLAIDPFDREDIFNAILEYLKTFAHLPSTRIAQRWHGVYAKTKDGSAYWTANPHPGVVLVNGLGGAGMTLSFGLAEKVVSAW